MSLPMRDQRRWVWCGNGIQRTAIMSRSRPRFECPRRSTRADPRNGAAMIRRALPRGAWPDLDLGLPPLTVNSRLD